LEGDGAAGSAVQRTKFFRSSATADYYPVESSMSITLQGE
jgi:hypothetical protein